MIKYHLEKLIYFFEIAKLGSINAASKELNITQPSLTKSIKILESAIGQKLFTRLPRGMKVTEHGEILLNYCHDFFARINELELALSNPKDPYAGSLRVGTYDSIAIYFWPKFLKIFLKKYPKIELELTTGRSKEIQLKIEKGQLDIGLIIEPTPSPYVENIILKKDSFLFYKSTKNNNLFKSDKTSPLIYMADAHMGAKGQVIQNLINSSKNNRKIYKTSSLESAKELAINGLGISLLPTLVAQEEVKKNNLKKISLESFPTKKHTEHSIGIVYSKHRKSSIILQELINNLKESTKLGMLIS